MVEWNRTMVKIGERRRLRWENQVYQHRSFLFFPFQGNSEGEKGKNQSAFYFLFFSFLFFFWRNFILNKIFFFQFPYFSGFFLRFAGFYSRLSSANQIRTRVAFSHCCFLATRSAVASLWNDVVLLADWNRLSLSLYWLIDKQMAELYKGDTILCFV